MTDQHDQNSHLDSNESKHQNKPAKDPEKGHQLHDKTLKTAMEYPQFQREAVEQMIPAQYLKDADLNSIRPSKLELINRDHERRMTDVLLEIDIKDDTSYMYFLFEGQSQPDYWLPLRIMIYRLGILDQHVKRFKECKKLPLVFVGIFYNGKRTPYPYPLNYFDLFDQADTEKAIINRDIPILDCGQYSDSELIKREGQWLSPLILLSKHIWDTFIDDAVLEDIIRLAKTIESGPHSQDYIVYTVLGYFVKAGEVKDKAKALDIITREFSPEIRGKVMTIAEQLRTEGWQEGQQQGYQKGQQQGYQKGQQQGAHQEKHQIAANMLNKGSDTTFVAEVTGLSLDEVERLKAQTEH